MKLVFLFLSSFLFTGCFAQKTTGTGSATVSTISREQAREALDFHNKARKDVGVPALEWSDELAAFAQAWAEKLASDGCQMKHRPASGQWAQQYGENIFWGSGRQYSGLDASKSWYAEIKDYNHSSKNENRSRTGHYTQMVWKSTTKLGMGMATCPNGATIIVANYSPAGNWVGQKPY